MAAARVLAGEHLGDRRAGSPWPGVQVAQLLAVWPAWPGGWACRRRTATGNAMPIGGVSGRGVASIWPLVRGPAWSSRARAAAAAIAPTAVAASRSAGAARRWPGGSAGAPQTQGLPARATAGAQHQHHNERVGRRRDRAAPGCRTRPPRARARRRPTARGGRRGAPGHRGLDSKLVVPRFRYCSRRRARARWRADHSQRDVPRRPAQARSPAAGPERAPRMPEHPDDEAGEHGAADGPGGVGGVGGGNARGGPGPRRTGRDATTSGSVAIVVDGTGSQLQPGI